MVKKIFILICTMLLLTSCSSLLSPVPETPKQTYLLADPIRGNSPYNNGANTLSVTTLASPDWLNTKKMVYELQPNQINYYAKNEWAAAPAVLLQPIIVHALQQSGHYRAVIMGPSDGNTDQKLDLNLLAMQQEFFQNKSLYCIIIQAQLIDMNTQQILASQRFSATAVAPTNDAQGGVTAANHAVAQITSQIARFCRQY